MSSPSQATADDDVCPGSGQTVLSGVVDDAIHCSTCGRKVRVVHGDTIAWVDEHAAPLGQEPATVSELRSLLAELYRHDANNYGPWTMGMKRRVRAAAGLD